jgi:hypothetical protein
MKLMKALKTKNRIVGEINRLKNILKRDNSVELHTIEEDKRAAVEGEMLKKMEELIKVKSAISTANMGIYNSICRMEELKSLKAYYNTLDTTHGEVTLSSRFIEKETTKTYNAYLTQEKVDDKLKELQQQIDTLQDKIDEYNAITEVTI